MFTRLILLALIAGLVYLNYTTPTLADHQDAILAGLEEGSWPIPEEQLGKIWSDVDYSNFLVCSFMKTKVDSRMISSGYLKKVKVVNDKWLSDMRQELQRSSQY